MPAGLQIGYKSPSAISEAPNPRKRGRTACTRCKNRKQKCDDQLPICSNCRRAGAACDKAEVAEDLPPVSYTRALEERVAFLEKKLMLQDDDGHATEPSGDSSSPPFIPGLGKNSVVLDSALVALGVLEAPAYVGSSSGLSLATTLGDMVQATVWTKSFPKINDTSSTVTGTTSTEQDDRFGQGRRITIDELVAYSVKEPPSDELGSKAISVYLSQLHARYPFLDPEEIWDLHRKRHDLAKSETSKLTRSQRFGLFKLYLIYAMGATLLQLTDKRPYEFSPETLYLTALQHISAARDSRTIQNIEAMTLLVLYHLRSSSCQGMWYMVGLAMRTCVDLGMHRKAHENNLDPAIIQRRRRLFWVVYALERTIAISLGRPLSISDRQIDVPMPDSEFDSTNPMLDPNLLVAPVLDQPGPLTLALCMYRIRRIESRIHQSIYRADKPLSSLLPKVDRLYAALVEWRNSLSLSFPTTSAEYDYLQMHYHRAIRLLIQPFLPILTPSDTYYTHCVKAAGEICQGHKRLHQTPDYAHSFVAVQTVFVAGLTLIYGLWRWTKQVWTASLAEDIRACSTVLFVMGEREHWVKRYRDAFEVLASAAMKKLSHDESNPAPQTQASQTDQRPAKRRNLGDQTANTPTELAPLSEGLFGDGTQDLSIQGQQEHDYGLDLRGSLYDIWQQDGGDVYDGTGATIGDGSAAWPIVMELANWFEQDGAEPTSMTNFETLQNLTGY